MGIVPQTNLKKSSVLNEEINVGLFQDRYTWGHLQCVAAVLVGSEVRVQHLTLAEY